MNRGYRPWTWLEHDARFANRFGRYDPEHTVHVHIPFDVKAHYEGPPVGFMPPDALRQVDPR